MQSFGLKSTTNLSLSLMIYSASNVDCQLRKYKRNANWVSRKLVSLKKSCTSTTDLVVVFCTYVL